MNVKWMHNKAIIFIFLLAVLVSNSITVLGEEINNVPELSLSSPKEDPVLSDQPGFNKLEVSGTVKDADVGDRVEIYYSIGSDKPQKLDTLIADGSEQEFKSKEIPINRSIDEGEHLVQVWAEDDKGGLSEQMEFTIYVKRTKPKEAKFREIEWNDPKESKRKKVAIEYSEDAVIREYQINEEGWFPYSEPLELSIAEETKISARSVDHAGNESISSIIITPFAIYEIQASPSSATLVVGQTQQLIIHKLTDKDGCSGTCDVTDRSTYSSNEPTVATVSSGGLITAKSAGYATIHVEYKKYEIAYRTSVQVTVKPLPDNTPPRGPDSISVLDKSDTLVWLTWPAATDNVGVTEYEITYGSITKRMTGRYLIITDLTPNTTYTFTVKARDAAGNRSSGSSITVKTDPLADTTPPTAPTNLKVTSKTDTSASLSWSPSTDNVGVTGYEITYGSTTLNTTSTSYTVTGLTVNTSYTFTVKARDAAGNRSTGSSISVTTNQAIDTTPPTVPTNLNLTSKTDTSVSLFWSPSTDNVGVTGYEITYGSTTLNTTSTSYTVTGLTANTMYTFTVKARDAAGNRSTGATITVTTNPPSSLTISKKVLSESSKNDGTFSEVQLVTLSNGTFVANISSGVTVNRLPEGLGILVNRVSDTQLSIAFTGKATRHSPQDNVRGASITISKNLIVGGSSDVTSEGFDFEFLSESSSITYVYRPDSSLLDRIEVNGVTKVTFEYDQNGNLLRQKQIND